MRTYDGWIETWTPECEAAADKWIADNAIESVKRTQEGQGFAHYDVCGVWPNDYSTALDALSEVGRAGTDWNFPLD